MKFLIINDSPNAPIFYKQGIKNALEYCGHSVEFFHPSQSLFDICHRFKPDVLYTNSYSIDNQTIKIVQKYDNLKVILRSNDWGDNLKDVGPEYPIGRVSEQEIRTVEILKQLIGDRLCFVFTHYHPNKIEYTMGEWTKQLGIKAVALSNSADVLTYLGGKFRYDLSCDVSMISGFWDYKARNLKPYFFPLCHPEKKLNVKIFGNSAWPLAQYLGMLDEESVKDLFVSSKINLNIHEPHSTRFGYDVNERIFKVMASGGFLIGDFVKSIEEDYFPNGGIALAMNPKDMDDSVEFYLKNPNKRTEVMKVGHEQVLSNYTYFHQIERLFHNIGEPGLASEVNMQYSLFRKLNKI